MAILGSCRCCGRRVSDEALVCPGCGQPTPYISIDESSQSRQTVRAASCILDRKVVNIDDALKLRDSAKEEGRPNPEFRCEECGAPVRAFKAGGNAAAHFEHVEANRDCTRSDSR